VKTAAWLLTGAVALLDAAILAAVSVATANLEREHSGPPADEVDQPGAEAEVASYCCASDALHVLKSSSETVGSFFRKATIDQISWSGTPIAPKLGMAVILIPFLMTQNSCRGSRSLTMSLRSGG
jgi:hypothetical protein